MLCQLGHQPRIIPAIYVKPFVKHQEHAYFVRDLRQVQKDRVSYNYAAKHHKLLAAVTRELHFETAACQEKRSDNLSGKLCSTHTFRNHSRGLATGFRHGNRESAGGQKTIKSPIPL